MIDLEVVYKNIIAAAQQALFYGAKGVEARAKQLAPVRNIFGDSYRFRQKTAAEFSHSLRFVSTKAIEEMQTEGIGHFGTTVTGKRPPRHWRERRSTAAHQLLGEYDQEMASRRLGGPPEPATLTRQGAYEVRSKRADFSTWGHTHVGGRLRGEITTARPSFTADGAEVWVISPTPYARYQEFGTRHNRAHPYLRPAAEESRGSVVSAISDAVREASKKGVSAEIEVVVRL